MSSQSHGNRQKLAASVTTGLLPWQDDNYGRVIMLGASYKF